MEIHTGCFYTRFFYSKYLCTFVHMATTKGATYTIRPNPKKKRQLDKAIRRKMKSENIPSVNRAIEAALLQHFNIT